MKNIQGVSFLRNGRICADYDAALSNLGTYSGSVHDGEAIVVRYYDTNDSNKVKSILGIKYLNGTGTGASLTIFDNAGTEAEIQAVLDEMHNTFGTGVTTANTATAQLAALSGTAGASSAETSVAGAKAYAKDYTDAEIDKLDYTGVTTGTGVYVTNVTEANGIISATTATLPSVSDSAVAKQFVAAVSETNGQIAVTRGEIESSGKTIVLTADENDVNFEVNIDGETIVKDADGVLSVASAALTQYVGDEKTIHISDADAQNNKTVSTLLTISATTPSETNVKEQYNLVNASGETIGSTIKIYKDSSLYNVYLGHMDDTIAGDPPVVTPGTGDTALCFIYYKADGTYQLVPVNVESFLEESEFASGVTATNHIVHGVVDPTSEKDGQATPVDFLTVGANGFKVSGIKDEIDRKLNAIVEDLDANVSGNSTHVTVGVVEADGVISAVTVSESKIADADDLAALSAKTVTEIASTNGSIGISTANTADDTVEVDVTTDASKIKMSGFTSTDALSGITSSSSITEAFKEVDAVITEDERVTAEALTDLNDKINALSGASLSGVTVNNAPLSVSDNVASLTIAGSTSAGTASTTEAICVNTDANGNITLSLGYIDCGTYDEDEP